MGSSKNNQSREHWSGSFAFILAAVGSAVGLGNIWKFPYMAGENGGGAFVIIYLLCIAVIGIPIFIAELYVGKKGQTDTVSCFRAVAPRSSGFWKTIGFLGVASTFLILSFYSVVTGWVLDFTWKSVTNQMADLNDKQIQSLLTGLFQDPWRMLMWHTITMVITVGIVCGGITAGIERFTKILMPTLVLMLLVVFGWSMTLEGFPKAFSYLFSADFSKISPESILSAVGHSFFTLSLGMGCMITYGSYLRPKDNIIKVGIAVSLLDTLIALIAGMAIFAVVFSFDNIEPSGGPGLMFVTLPMLFHKVSGGFVISSLFFLLVTFAAITSAISLLEVAVSYFINNLGYNRKKTTIVTGVLVYLLGILSVLSFNVLEDFKLFGKYNFFDFFDGITTNILMPLGGVLIALFMGWVLGKKAIKDIFPDKKHALWGTGLLFMLRFVAPACVIWVLVKSTLSWIK